MSRRLSGSGPFTLLISCAGVLVFSVACSRKPDPAKTLESVSSWLATATMAGDAWVVHSTPNPFTRNTLRRARMTVADQQRTLFTASVPRVDTASLRASLDRAKNRMATMEKLIDTGDAKRFPALLALLKADAARVKQMSDSLKADQ